MERDLLPKKEEKIKHLQQNKQYSNRSLIALLI